MRRTIILGMAGFFLLAGLVSSVFPQKKLVRKGRYFVGQIDKSGRVDKSGQLEIRDFKGDVRVTGWDRQAFEIHEKIKMDIFSREEAKKGLTLSENSISVSRRAIQIDGHDFRSWMTAVLEIKVPRNFSTRIGVKGGDVAVHLLQGDQTISTSGGDVALEDLKGRVIARTSGGDIEVNRFKGNLSVSTSGGDLRLVTISGEVNGSTSGGDIFVKECGDRVHVATSGGEIDVFGVNGDLNASTSGGDIRVREVLGRVDVHTSGGDLIVQHAAKDVYAATSGGDIRISDVQQKVRAKTSGGDISINGAGGAIVALTSGGEIDIRKAAASVTAKTSGGNVFVEMTPDDSSRSHSAKIFSSGGDLKLVIPAKMPAHIFAEIKIRQQVFGHHFTIHSDFPLKIRTLKKSGWRKEIQAVGEINGGGDQLELHTVNGNIDIRKK